MDILILTAGAFVLSQIMSWWCNKLYRAMCDYLDAHDELSGWRASNPGVYLGLSDTGKLLLRRTIEAYDTFRRYHPYVEDDGYRDYLLSLFDDLPPLKRKPLRRGFLLAAPGNSCYYCPYICQQT
jgi:hypothetical protein